MDRHIPFPIYLYEAQRVIQGWGLARIAEAIRRLQRQMKLIQGAGGVDECDPGVAPGKVRRLLRNVALATGTALRIQLDGSRIVFIPKEEAKVVHRRKDGEDTQT